MVALEGAGFASPDAEALVASLLRAGAATGAGEDEAGMLSTTLSLEELKRSTSTTQETPNRAAIHRVSRTSREAAPVELSKPEDPAPPQMPPVAPPFESWISTSAIKRTAKIM